LTKNSGRLDTTITNLNHTVYNFSKISDSLAEIEVQPIVAKLDETLDNFNNISTKLNEGNGSLGKLINDNAVYENIDHATRQLEELLQDIKLHPRRYINVKFSIFGGKNKAKPYEKPEHRSD